MQDTAEHVQAVRQGTPLEQIIKAGKLFVYSEQALEPPGPRRERPKVERFRSRSPKKPSTQCAKVMDLERLAFAEELANMSWEEIMSSSHSL